MSEKNSIVPFGRYKGQPLEALAADREYLEWLTAQGWFREKYPQHYTLILNNFQEPSETPEHNALQARFLDRGFCSRVLTLLLERPCDFTEPNPSLPDFIGKRFFEDDFGENKMTPEYKLYLIEERNQKWMAVKFEEKGWDVRIDSTSGCVCLELKPTLGDDYPAVLRTMKNLPGENKSLIAGQYHGTGATIEQVRQIFAASHIKVLLMDEINK